jgi:hypothetical protein
MQGGLGTCARPPAARPRMRRLPHRPSAVLAAFALLGLLQGAATCRPPPDPDGDPSGAKPLGLDEWHADGLDCRHGDCADWYLVRLRDRGTLHVEVDAKPGDPKASFSLAMADGRAQVLEESAHPAGQTAALQHEVTPGAYFVRVSAPAKSPLVAYQLRASLEVPKAAAPPPPPEPRFRTLEAEVLEVEGPSGGQQFVLFGRGESDGLRRSQRGRLVQNGETLAAVEVTEVFPEGTRARLLGPPTRPITPQATVQIDIPLDSEGGTPEP